MSTPQPPQGGYQAYGQPHQPHPQHQAPYGQQPYGQQPYGQQPPAPRPPSGGGGGLAGRQKLIKAVAVVIALVVAGVWYFVKKDEPTTPSNSQYTASVGDCMKKTGNGDDELEKVDCSDSAATYRVESNGSAEDCKPGQLKYTETRRHITVLTLCLSEIKK
ncbi:hypothetical protein NGF19_22740 [Streptomyces sp. RY43-2]|uniref:Uncharacterized protein n=1 Tax=Streptomyces macrolidinus TaxID=2952607 RepID=A0ABT0ZJ53_9ACTN|nr:hypothetical protein [Streptomyces macrolidinus]MCN9243570.1 hypothetical protein [Streptomyces macrolidinus]